jgi:hypothetical protein
MNYRTFKTSKTNLTSYNFNKDIINNIVLRNLYNFSTLLVKVFKSLLNLLFTPTKYIYDDVNDTYRPCNDNYYFRDVTDLQLKASRRTFL